MSSNLPGSGFIIQIMKKQKIQGWGKKTKPEKRGLGILFKLTPEIHPTLHQAFSGGWTDQTHPKPKETKLYTIYEYIILKLLMLGID